MFSFLYKWKNNRYSLVKIGDIINNYSIPNCQRHIKKERVNFLNDSIMMSFNPITPLYFCVYKNKRYIIDGSHRLECYKISKYLHDHSIPIIDIFTNDESDIYNYFTLINDQLNR